MADEEIQKAPDSTQIEIPMKDLESEDSKSIYHEILPLQDPKRFLLNIILIKKFHGDLASNSSKKFQLLASNFEEELNEIFPSVNFSLQKVLKIGILGRKIFATFACEMNSGEMDVETFERRLRKFVLMGGERLTQTRARFWELKCREVSEEEFEHFKKFGFDCCDNCGEFEVEILNEIGLKVSKFEKV